MTTEGTQELAEGGPDRDRPAEVGTGHDGSGRHRRRWPAVVAGSAAIAVAVVMAAVLVDGDGAERVETPTSSSPPASSAPTTAEPDVGTTETVETTTTTAAVAGPVLVDGRHPVYLTGLDVAAGTVEFDLIQFLGGAEAEAAYRRDNPDAPPGGPPNDYYILNENPRLRVLPVAEGAAITVLDWSAGFQPRSIAFADLPGALAGDLVPEDDRLWPSPFWLTVDDASITAMEEQYIP